MGKNQDLKLYHRHALIHIYDNNGYYGTNYGTFYRNIYRLTDGKFIIKYNNKIRTVYLSKITGNVWGWFLNPKA